MKTASVPVAICMILMLGVLCGIWLQLRRLTNSACVVDQKPLIVQQMTVVLEPRHEDALVPIVQRFAQHYTNGNHLPTFTH